MLPEAVWLPEEIMIEAQQRCTCQQENELNTA
jgi:hypothetical protein